MIWSSSNFFPSLHYRIPRKIQISTIASISGKWSGNAKLVLLLEFGKPAVQSLPCLRKMSYSVHISVHEDVSHSIALSIILRSRSSLRMETSFLNAICIILVWIQYKIGKDNLFLYNTWRHLRGVGIYVHLLLSLALGGSEWLASLPQPLNPQRKIPQYPLNRWLGQPQIWYGLSLEGGDSCSHWDPINSSI